MRARLRYRARHAGHCATSTRNCASKRKGPSRHIPVAIGIGLNTGYASVGNFGSMQRFTYSCIGNDVNLASRLEGSARTYGVGIIIGENTRKQAAGYADPELDLVMLKGKTEPERAHALLGDVAMVQRPDYQAWCGGRRSSWRSIGGQPSQRRSGAHPGRRRRRRPSAGTRATTRSCVRVDGLIDDSPPDWTGVYVAKKKCADLIAHRSVGLPRCRQQDGRADHGKRGRPGRRGARPWQRHRVGLITGFFVPRDEIAAPETDGPVGTALLAAALAACGVPTRIAVDTPVPPRCVRRWTRRVAAWPSTRSARRAALARRATGHRRRESCCRHRALWPQSRRQTAQHAGR